MKRLITLALAASLLATPAWAKDKGKGKGKDKGGDKRELSMKAGTKQLGGSATLDITSAGGGTGVLVNISPNGGYFLADNLEGIIETNFIFGGGASTIGVGAGAKYFIDSDPMWIYVGGTVGFQQVSVGGVGGTAFAITPMGGLLLPLDQNVGLDIGTRVQIVPAGGAVSLYIPVGYLGVQAFWK